MFNTFNKMIKYRFIILLHLYPFVAQKVNTEFYSSLHKMEVLVDTQRKVIRSLNNLVKSKTHSNKILVSYLQRLKVEHQTAIADIPKFIGNPVNCFRLIKRLTVDINLIDDILNGSLILKKDQSVTYPTQEDLVGAAEGLLRLESIYDLKKTDLANGILNTSYGRDRKLYLEKFNPMTVSDCYELGKALCRIQYYSHSIEWLKEAQNKKLGKLHRYPEDDGIHIDDIKYEIDRAHKGNKILFGNFTLWFQKILNIMPNITNINPNVIVEFYKNALSPIEAIETINARQNVIESLGTSKLENVLNDLCKGYMKNPEKIFKRMKCYLAHGPHPFLILAPMKAEQLYLAPVITLFYNVISDTEIQILQNLAKPRFERAKVGTNTNYDYSNNRISQIGYARSNESNEVARIKMRVTHISGMDLKNSERLQIANYGIGGHFSPHYDYWSNDTLIDQEGNRIATALFYMTEVELGGATIFPRLGLTLFPIKGAMLFWTNLLSSGRGNPYTYHSACPVLRGSKWVATQWINLRGQELNQPCPLEDVRGHIRDTIVFEKGVSKNF